MSGFDLPPLRGLDGPAFTPRLRDVLVPTERLQEPSPRGDGLPLGERVPLDGLPLGGGEPGARRFDGLLADSLEQIKSLQDDTKAKVRGLALGEDVELHDVMIAGNKSEVAFNLLLEVRNKLVEAWEKLSRSAV